MTQHLIPSIFIMADPNPQRIFFSGWVTVHPLTTVKSVTPLFFYLQSLWRDHLYRYLQHKCTCGTPGYFIQVKYQGREREGIRKTPLNRYTNSTYFIHAFNISSRSTENQLLPNVSPWTLTNHRYARNSGNAPLYLLYVTLVYNLIGWVALTCVYTPNSTLILFDHNILAQMTN